MSAALLVHDLHQHYGAVHALKGVSFEVAAGECVALIGPNGAGKSSCFACLSGQQPAKQGKVIWREQSLLKVPAEGRRALGVARTFQVAQVFEALSVFQNLQLAFKAVSGVSMFDSLDQCESDKARNWLMQMGLDDLSPEALHSPAMNLSYGAKKRLELAVAMAGLQEPRSGLLLLDEPAAGLSPTERADMMQRVKALSKAGTTSRCCQCLGSRAIFGCQFGCFGVFVPCLKCANSMPAMVKRKSCSMFHWRCLRAAWFSSKD